MALFDPDFFTSAQARWNWLRSEAPRSLFELPASELLPFLRSEGFKIGDDTFQLIYNQVKAEGQYSGFFGDLKDNELIPAQWHIKNHGLFLSDNFLYRFEATIQDRKTGEISVIGSNILANTQQVFGDVRSEVLERLNESSAKYEFDVISFGLQDALTRPGVFIE